jgi:hypothetical protein
MQGFITENELDQADQEFPGIARLFTTLAEKPRTFLELVAQYDHWTTTRVRNPLRRPGSDQSTRSDCR